MNSTVENEPEGLSLGASVFVPVPAARLYEALLDVRNFPCWAPSVRRVEVLEGGPGTGMVSEWELSVLGMRKRVLSLLETADSSGRLRWTYEGPVHGWGACVLRERGCGTVADFSTELHVTEPVLDGWSAATKPDASSSARSNPSHKKRGTGVPPSLMSVITYYSKWSAFLAM